MRASPLYVIKLGSETLLSANQIYDEIAILVKEGSRVLLVAGGSKAIKEVYLKSNRTELFRELSNGHMFRYVPQADVPLILSAYDSIIHPHIQKKIKAQDLTIFSAQGYMNKLVTAKRVPQVRVVEGNKSYIVRDHHLGQYLECDQALNNLLDIYDVVCISPMVADSETGIPLNIDADLLAAELACSLDAHHLRFLTNTQGILRNIEQPSSTISDLYANHIPDYVRGRMKQKVRACNLAVNQGFCSVSICGSSSILSPEGTTRFWTKRIKNNLTDRQADLAKVLSIPSVSYNERELCMYLIDWCKEHNIKAYRDEVGNLIAIKGKGKSSLLMVGHLDTVPFPWNPSYSKEGVSSRGCVDARSCLYVFLRTLAEISVQENCTVTVVGAIEEEISSSKGAFHILKSIKKPNAIFIGEPSGTDAITLGYFGLFKIALSVKQAKEHSAGKDASSVFDTISTVITDLKNQYFKVDPNGLSSVINFTQSENLSEVQAECIFNARVSPDSNLKDYEAIIRIIKTKYTNIQFDILRKTPGKSSGLTNPLCQVMRPALVLHNKKPRFIIKKGTSDMNTLSTQWSTVPMVAYGPGDSSLDHTEHEYISFEDVDSAIQILTTGVNKWFSKQATLKKNTHATMGKM